MLKYLHTTRPTYGAVMTLLLVAGCLFQALCFGLEYLVGQAGVGFDAKCGTGAGAADFVTEAYCRKTIANAAHAEELMYTLGLISNWCLILSIYCAVQAYRPDVRNGETVHIIKP